MKRFISASVVAPVRIFRTMFVLTVGTQRKGKKNEGNYHHGNYLFYLGYDRVDR